MSVGTVNGFDGPYLANGSTTAFPFTFTVQSGSDVSVLVRDGDGEEIATPSYSVTLNGAAPTDGTVVFAAAPTSGYTVIPYLDPAFTQEVQFADGSAWLAAPVNDANDRSALRDQALRRDLDRAILVPLGSDGATLDLDAYAGKVIGVSAGLEFVPVTMDDTLDGSLRADLAAVTGGALVGVAASGTGAAARTVAAKLRDTISIADFGATSASADASAEVQAAIDALPATGGTILVPFICNVKDIRINGTARNKANVVLRGAGWGTGFRLPNTSGAVNLIDGEGAVGCRVENMLLDLNRTGQTPVSLVDGPDYENYNGVYFEGATECDVTRCKIKDALIIGVMIGAPWTGKTGADRCRVEACLFENCTTAVTGMRQRFNSVVGNMVYRGAGTEDYHLLLDEYSTDCLVSDNIVDGDSAAAGIYAFRASRNIITNNKVANCLVSILLSDAACDNKIAGNHCRDAGNSHIKQVNGCLRNSIRDNNLDTAAQYCIVSELGTGGSTYVVIQGNRCRAAGYSNIAIFGSGWSLIENNYCWEANGSGIYVSGSCDWTEINDNYCFNNSLTSLDDAGIRLLGQNNLIVEDNKCFDSQSTKTQNWGIRGNESAPGTVSYKDNDVRFNLTAGMALAGTPVVKENLGWTTEAFGQVALPSAATSVTVTHGLAMTPDLKSVRVSFYDATVRSSKVAYVANVGATTFEVRVDAAPGADTVLTWEAKCFV